MSKLSWLIRRWSKREPAGICFSGDYTAWSDALRDSKGYDSPLILDKTRAALLKVKNGEAAYERDSVLFDKVEHSFPVLAGLLRASVANGDRLSVVDFGGALGSTYYQCRAFLSPLKSVQWCVVEQPGHVKCGQRDFASEELHFYHTVEECLQHHSPDLLLMSSVLQYLPDPYGMLRHLLALGFRHVIVDRTAFLVSDRDRLTVQTVPPFIYAASYPAWFLSETRIRAVFGSMGYTLVTDFEGADRVAPADEPAVFKGFIYDRQRSDRT